MEREMLIGMLKEIKGCKPQDSRGITVGSQVELAVVINTGSLQPRIVESVGFLEFFDKYIAIQQGRMRYMYPYEAIMGLEYEDRPEGTGGAGFVRS